MYAHTVSRVSKKKKILVQIKIRLRKTSQRLIFVLIARKSILLIIPRI